MINVLWVACGGAIGSVLRWLLASAVQSRANTTFPFGILAVNVLGCLAIGVLGALASAPERPREDLRLFAIVGVLGGFTTMSAFAWDSVSLAHEGLAARALLYVLLTNVLCLCAAWCGLRLVQTLRGA